MIKMSSLKESETRLSKLKALAKVLAVSIDMAEDKSVAPLARQYRETIKEIEEIEGTESNDDKISEILSERKSDGKPGAVRKNRSRL